MDAIKTKLKLSKKTQPAFSKTDEGYFSMRMVLMFFKMVGLAPWHIVRRSPREKGLNNDVSPTSPRSQLACSKLDCIYPIFLVIAIFGIWLSLYPELGKNEEFKNARITLMLERAQSVSGNMIAVVARIMLCVKQKKVVKLYNRFENIDSTAIRLINQRESKFNGLFFVALFSIDVSLWVMNMVTLNWCFGAVLASLSNHLLPAMCRNWFVMQYIVMVKLVTRRFRNLNRALLDKLTNSNVQSISSRIVGDPAIKPNDGPRIVTFRRTYTALYEINRDVCNFYSLPIVLTSAHSCYSAICCVYYLVDPIVSAESNLQLCGTINLLIWLTSTMLPIVMLAAVVNENNSEMEKIPDAVHELLAEPSTSREDKLELRQFSFGVVQRKVNFTAYGLFSLHPILLHSIFSTVIQYLMIIVQFQLSQDGKSA